MSIILIPILILLAIILSSINILKEYERAVIFTLGRFTSVSGPGLIIVIPIIQQMDRVDMRVVVMDIPPQDVISRDNISVKVNAVLYFRVINAEKAIIQVEEFYMATSQLAQTTLRSVMGQHELDEMLAEREKINSYVQKIVDDIGEYKGHSEVREPWNKSQNQISYDTFVFCVHSTQFLERHCSLRLR